ncbi:MAG: DHH family phosphoesterase, partial [Desulfuromonadales bacterium]
MDLITTHQHADFDGMASMIAAKKLFPLAVMAFSGSQEKNIRDFFVQSTEYLYDFQRLKNIDLSKVSRLIVVDTRQAARIGRIADCLSNPGLELHLYDHHPDAPGDLKGDYEFIRPVGSTATIFAQLFQDKVISISGDEATLLGMAIYEDTGSFTFDTTTPDDLAAMAWLLAQGANLQTISQFISQELSAEQIALLHDMISSASS